MTRWHDRRGRGEKGERKEEGHARWGAGGGAGWERGAQSRAQRSRSERGTMITEGKSWRRREVGLGRGGERRRREVTAGRRG
eukprot:3455668-Rhodomonas_salina.1